MGLLDKLVGGAAASPVEAVGGILKTIMGDKGEKMTHEQIMAKLAMAPDIAQSELNKIEAGHRSVFVSGWRPFIGWVCGSGLAYAFLISPFLGIWFTVPELETDIMMELVLAMLGLGALRTVEKLKGKTK